jgi:hypothetical protein
MPLDPSQVAWDGPDAASVKWDSAPAPKAAPAIDPAKVKWEAAPTRAPAAKIDVAKVKWDAAPYNPRMDEEPAQGSWLANQWAGRGHLYGGDFGKAINKGHAEEMLSYAGAVPGNEKQTHETIQNIEQAYPTQPGRLDTLGRAVGGMISQVPQMVLGPGAMAPLGGIAAYGRARAEGSSVPAAAAHGVVGAALGAAQLPIAKGIAGQALSRLPGRAASNTAVRLGVNTAANYAEQVAAGAAGTVAGNAIDKASIDPNRPLTQGLSNVPYTAIPGALAGGAVMTAHGAAPRPEAPAAEAPPQDQLAGQPDIVAQEAAIDAAEPRLTAQAQADQAEQQQHDAALAAQGRAPFPRATADEVISLRQKAAELRLPPPGEKPEDSATYAWNASKERATRRQSEKFGFYKIDMPIDLLAAGNKIYPNRMARQRQIGGTDEPGFATIDKGAGGEDIYTVDDGNHRVEYARQTGKKTVPMFVQPTEAGQLERLKIKLEDAAAMDEENAIVAQRQQDRQQAEQQAAAVAMDFETQIGQMNPRQLYDAVKARGLNPRGREFNTALLLRMGPEQQAPEPVQAPMRGEVRVPQYGSDQLNRLQNPTLRRQADLLDVPYDTRGTTIPRILDAQERRRLGQLTPKQLWDEVRSRGLRAGSKDQNIETLLSAGLEKPVQPQAQAPQQPVQRQQQAPQQGTPEDGLFGGAQEEQSVPQAADKPFRTIWREGSGYTPEAFDVLVRDGINEQNARNGIVQGESGKPYELQVGNDEAGRPTIKSYREVSGATQQPTQQETPRLPPVAPGYVRMYHGGKPPGPGESRWLTPDQKYAEGYASKSGSPVSYVDIPKSSPHLTKSFDDTDTGTEAPYNSFNAPPEIAAGLKPVAPAKEKSPEPVSTGASTQMGRSSPGVPGRAASEAPEAPFTVTTVPGPVKPEVAAAPAPRPAKTPFTKPAVEKLLLDFHEKMGGGYTRQDEIAMEGDRAGNVQAARSTGDPFTFLGKFPGEVKRYLEQSPTARRQAKKLFKLTDDPKAAGGEDAMHSLGEGGYFDMADKLIGSHVADAKKTARESRDPVMQFWAEVHDNIPPPRERPAQIGVKASDLNVGKEWEMNGSKFQVIENEDGLRILKDGDEYSEVPLDAFGDQKLPVDKNTLRDAPEPEVPDDVFADVREEPQPFTAREGPKGIFGQETFEPVTGKQAGGLFHEPAKVEAPQRTGKDAKIAQQYDEAATPTFEQVEAEERTRAERRRAEIAATGDISDPAEAEQPKPATTAKERYEQRLKENTPKVEAIKKAIEAGRPIAVNTQLRSTRLTSPEHIKLGKDGNVYTRERSEWVALFPHQVENLIAQAGHNPETLKGPPNAETVRGNPQPTGDEDANGRGAEQRGGDLQRPAKAEPAAGDRQERGQGPGQEEGQEGPAVQQPKQETVGPWKEKIVSRRVNNSQRDIVIRTFTGKTSAEYDAFLDSRPEGSEMRRGTKAPTVDIDGRPQYASYEFRHEPPPPKPPEILGHGSSPKRPSPEKVKTDLARAVVGTTPTPAPAADKSAAPAKSEPAVMTAAWDGLRKIFAPQTRTEDAGRAAGYAREHGAETAQRIDRAEADLREARKLFASKTRDENLAFIDKMERGEKQGEGAKEAFAAQIRKLLDERRTEVQKLGKGKLQHFIQDYFPHIWADPEKARQVFAQIAGKRPLEGSKSFLKKRTIPTIDEGIKLGLEPISDNPVDLVLLKLREMDRYIMGQRLLRDLKNAGLVKYVRATEQMPDGYAKIDDKIATVYGPPTVKVPEYVNKSMYDALSAVAKGLGVTHERKMTLGRSRALGLSYQGASKIETRFGTDLSVMAHEISHQLDDKHDLQGEFLEGRTKKFADELRTLADLHGYKEKYFRKKAEKMATLLEAYVRLGPEEMRRVAPTVSHEFTQYMKQVPALRAAPRVPAEHGLEEADRREAPRRAADHGPVPRPEAVAQVLNNYLSPACAATRVFRADAFRAYQGAANVLNQAQLGLSFFHAGFTSFDASISKFASRWSAGRTPCGWRCAARRGRGARGRRQGGGRGTGTPRRRSPTPAGRQASQGVDEAGQHRRPGDGAARRR